MRVTGTPGIVTSISNVGSDNKHVFDVVKGTYDVYDGTTTNVNVDCTGDTASTSF